MNPELCYIHKSVRRCRTRRSKFRSAALTSCCPQDDWVRSCQRSEATGAPLRIKLGLDPTAPDIHIGHTVVLNKMRQLQDLGHTVIFLIGDFTTTDRRPVRPQQHPPAADARADRGQRRRPTTARPAWCWTRRKTEIRYNCEWSDPLGARGMIQLAAKYTVARMMERDDFNKRFKAGQSISRARVPLPADAGLRLGGAQERPGTRRHRPEVQPARGPPPAAGIRPGAAVHPDHAAAGRAGRRREDVQEQEQLHRHQRRRRTPCSPRCCRSPTR